MSHDDKKLDDFWDLSSLIPKKSTNRSPSAILKPTNGVEVSFSHDTSTANPSDEASTVIKRYINPLHDENKRIRRESFISTEEYIPEGTLLHSVKLKKRKCAYELYEEFTAQAKKYSSAVAYEVPYVSFFSYVPQYNQMSAEQLEYYLWWRECFKNDIYIKTDLSYVLLYVYELINIGKAQDIISAQRMLAKLWNVYHKEYPSISGKLAVWICDFSLLHRMPPPVNIGSNIIKYVPSLKEFFIHIPNGDYEACVNSLLKYGAEYDYHTSKFATGQNILIFDKHIFGAMLEAVRFFSVEGRILSALASEDSKLVRNAFDGALCSSAQRYEIEVKYCSFSRSNELRYIVGDIVKYAENKIRGALGVKSKLSVYSIGIELQKVLDDYFEQAFATEQPVRTSKKVEKQEYDVLYDIPVRPLSLDNAHKIENDSWSTTFDLISAFEDEEDVISGILPTASEAVQTNVNTPDVSIQASNDGDLRCALGEYLPIALALKEGKSAEAQQLSLKLGKLIEAVIDIINEISAELIGDILIEDSGNGFKIVDCYKELL